MNNKMTREEKLAELRAIADQEECGMVETAFGMLFDFYEAAGFAREPLEAEFGAMDNDQIIDSYLKL